jgi:hypothetical protein
LERLCKECFLSIHVRRAPSHVQRETVKDGADDSLRLSNRRALGVPWKGTKSMSHDFKVIVDKHSAGVYRAIALRFQMRQLDMQGAAATFEGDISGRHGHASNEIGERYREAVDEYVHERTESAQAALALVEFAGVLAAEQLIGEILREPAGEKDVFAQTVALAGAADWINRVCYRELAERASRCPRVVVDNGNEDGGGDAA